MAVPSVGMVGDSLSRSQAVALTQLQRFTAAAAISSTKLATSERIATPGEDPAAFAASRQLRSQVSSLGAVAMSSQTNASLLASAVDALDTIQVRVDEIRAALLTAQSATSSERSILQAQIDATLAEIDSVAKNLRYGDRSFLDGQASLKAYRSISAAGAITNFSAQTGNSLTQNAGIADVRVNRLGSGLPTKTLNDGRVVLSLNVSITAANKATKGSHRLTAGGAAGGFAEFRVTGKLGTATLRIGSTAQSLAHLTNVAAAFNALAVETGVALTSDATDLYLTTVGFGSDDFVRIELSDVSASNTLVLGGVNTATDPVGTSGTSVSQAATATIQGVDVVLGGDFGTTAHFVSQGYDIEIDFSTADLTSATVVNDTLVVVLDQGATGVIGAGGSVGEQIRYGIEDFRASALGAAGPGIWAMTTVDDGNVGTGNTVARGNNILGADALSELGSSGRNSISSGNLAKGLASLNRATSQIIEAQGRLGALASVFGNAAAQAQSSAASATAADTELIGVDAAREVTLLGASQAAIAATTGVLAQTAALKAAVIGLISE